jgi:RHS repeat-associated protein
MEYDYSGMRVKKFAPGASSPTQYPFKGYEIAPDGTITKFIKIGIETFASKKTPPGEQSPSTQHFYHNDHLGGVNVISDINGAKEQLTEYEPWGSVSRSEGPTVGSPPETDTTHAFTGQEIDPETGLYYYGGRYYDAEIARFISPDIIIQEPSNPQNLNRYSYVINNPLLFVDPSGHFLLVDDATVLLLVEEGIRLGTAAKIAIGAAIGAAVGAATAALTHQDVGMGALTGAISGALFGAAGELKAALPLTGLSKITAGVVIHAVAGAASGAINTAITGGNVGTGALTGGLSAGVAAGFGSFLPDNFVAQFLGRTVIGGITGGISAEISGGNFGQGFAQGAQTAAIAYLANDLFDELIEQVARLNGMYDSQGAGRPSQCLYLGPLCYLRQYKTQGPDLDKFFRDALYPEAKGVPNAWPGGVCDQPRGCNFGNQRYNYGDDIPPVAKPRPYNLGPGGPDK